MQITAAVARENHRPLTIEPVRLDEPRADEVRVRLVATGICHSDAAVIKGYMPLSLPRVLGHEGAGIVDAIGAGVTRVKVGDPVVLSFGSCGQCRSCRDDLPAYCDSFAALNFGGVREDGSATLTDQHGVPINGSFFCQSSFATFALAKECSVVKVRADAPLELLGPMSCGLQTGAGTVLNVLKAQPETTLLILGIGAVGFAALWAARLLGVRRMIAADRVASRLALAAEFGADTIDTGRQDLAERLAESGGVDAVVETTGVPALAAAAIKSLRVRGTCAIVGASADPILSVPVIHMIPGRVIRGAREGDANPQKIIPYLIDRFMAGEFPVDRLVRFYDLDSINVAFQDAASGAVVKPIIRL